MRRCVHGNCLKSYNTRGLTIKLGNHNKNGYGLGMDDYLESLSWKDLI